MPTIRMVLEKTVMKTPLTLVTDNSRRSYHVRPSVYPSINGPVNTYRVIFFQWLFQPIQCPGLLFSSVIIFSQTVGLLR
jgi:hypothetical protein